MDAKCRSNHGVTQQKKTLPDSMTTKAWYMMLQLLLLNPTFGNFGYYHVQDFWRANDELYVLFL